jgi:GNAT superfamily N-acetyltransferase
MNNQSGQFMAKNKNGLPIILEWKKLSMLSPDFAQAMNSVWDVAREAYMPVEMRFLRAYPQVVGTEDYYKPFEPLFKDGLNAVDWIKAEETMQALLKTHFIFDVSTWGPEITAAFVNDMCYVVTVKDQQTKAVLGFITFLSRANYAAGDVKAMSFAVDPQHQNQGLAILLMCSILKINQDIKRIFACTRVTNKVVRRAYSFCGFTKDANPILDHAFNMEHWVFLEYKTEQQSTLQETTELLVELK